MKTFKTTIIITAGIITAILALLSVPVKAENAEELAIKKESKTTIINYQDLMETEQALLEDYINMNNIPNVELDETTVKLYDLEGNLVYEGLENESEDMINKGLFLVEFAGEKIYTLP